MSQSLFPREQRLGADRLADRQAASLKLLHGFPPFPPTITDSRTISNYVEDERTSRQLHAGSRFLGTAPRIRLEAASAQPPAEENGKMERYNGCTSGKHPSTVSIYPANVPRMLLWWLKLPVESNAKKGISGVFSSSILILPRLASVYG